MKQRILYIHPVGPVGVEIEEGLQFLTSQKQEGTELTMVTKVARMPPSLLGGGMARAGVWGRQPPIQSFRWECPPACWGVVYYRILFW